MQAYNTLITPPLPTHLAWPDPIRRSVKPAERCRSSCLRRIRSLESRAGCPRRIRSLLSSATGYLELKLVRSLTQQWGSKSVTYITLTLHARPRLQRNYQASILALLTSHFLVQLQQASYVRHRPTERGRNGILPRGPQTCFEKRGPTGLFYFYPSGLHLHAISSLSIALSGLNEWTLEYNNR